ncbi:hypothetical protein ACIPL1_24885 [Pseudomonas sp. NPDC090202]|uniref:hypothetical protein n=1 Tax=Pseudomonas sp. NPDC090202 TaxID=3364476 RepID=UPI003815C330
MGDVIFGGWDDRQKKSSDTDGTGTGGGDSELEARVAKLESHVEYMRRDISDLRSDVKAIAADIVALKLATSTVGTKLDHIDKHMVTKGQLSLYALLTLLPIIGGGWWIVQQYLAPLLKALPH